MLSVTVATREWIIVSRKGIREEELKVQIDLVFIHLCFFFDDLKLTFKQCEKLETGVFILFSTIQ